MKILILRGGALGDLIITLPVLREIRRFFPDAVLELLGIFPHAQLAVPEFVDRVERLDALKLVPLFFDPLQPSGLRSEFEEFDLAISFMPDPESTISRSLAAAGVKRVITFSNRIRSGVHAVFQLSEVLTPLGLSLRDPVPRLVVGPKPDRSSRLGLHVGSGSPKKNWPIDSWIELTQRLDGVFADFLLVGGEADKKVIYEFCSRCNIRRLKTLLNADLADLCQALNSCEIFVGHDTGVTHLAAAVGTPTVALFGPTDADVWAPLGDHVRVVRSADGSMESISVTEVLAAFGKKIFK